jgi:periplasmic divalent cation tolerance protein
LIKAFFTNFGKKMEKSQGFRIVFVTAVSLENARQIAKILLTEKLAACCSIIHNVTSLFGWEGALNERNEFLMIIKTAKSKVDDVEKRVSEIHPDEVPEILSIALEEGSHSYIKWLRQCIGED